MFMFYVGGVIDYNLYFEEIVVIVLFGVNVELFWSLDCFCCEIWFFLVVFVVVVKMWFNLLCLFENDNLVCVYGINGCWIFNL